MVDHFVTVDEDVNRLWGDWILTCSCGEEAACAFGPGIALDKLNQWAHEHITAAETQG